MKLSVRSHSSVFHRRGGGRVRGGGGGRGLLDPVRSTSGYALLSTYACPTRELSSADSGCVLSFVCSIVGKSRYQVRHGRISFLDGPARPMPAPSPPGMPPLLPCCRVRVLMGADEGSGSTRNGSASLQRGDHGVLFLLCRARLGARGAMCDAHGPAVALPQCVCSLYNSVAESGD